MRPDARAAGGRGGNGSSAFTCFADNPVNLSAPAGRSIVSSLRESQSWGQEEGAGAAGGEHGVGVCAEPVRSLHNARLKLVRKWVFTIF